VNAGSTFVALPKKVRGMRNLVMVMIGGKSGLLSVVFQGRPNRHAALCAYHSSLTFSHTILD
jgi:hypothetical protein